MKNKQSPPLLEVISLDTIQSETIDWLWYPYIPRGKITIMQGDPGQGKTMLALKIASILSTGDCFYGDGMVHTPGVVIYQTAEDGLADTIKPRLEAMGANCQNIKCIDEQKTALTLDDARIEQILQQCHPTLFIIDPIQAYLGVGVDMHRANEIRPIMADIGRLAEQYDCTFLFIVHMNKVEKGKALYRALGSVDIVGASRSLLIVGNNPNNPAQKILATGKSNLAIHGTSIAFHIDIQNGGIVFEGYSQLTADEIIVQPKNPIKKDSIALKEAKMFLKTYLEANNGGAESNLIKAKAHELDITDATLHRAKKDLNINIETSGYGKDKVSTWSLPIDNSSNLQADKIDSPDISLTGEAKDFMDSLNS